VNDQEITLMSPADRDESEPGEELLMEPEEPAQQ